MPGVRRTTLRGALVQSFASVGLAFAMLGGVVVLGPDATTAPVEAGTQPGDGQPGRALWETSYSERYPGCVSMVLWPLDEVPVALVTRTPAGAVTRVPLDEVDRAPLSMVGRAHAIGACRR